MSPVPNRLLNEPSLYLRQHAFNPVDWYPWGDEAFSRAKELDLPVFLSIGYAACHWCHVMAHQCFEDTKVASLLNHLFVSIKVDREERPDIDHIYMTACQAMTGSGGWPLSLFLTPEKRPFYAATYIPRESVPGMPGMLDILPHIAKIWGDKRDDINDVSHQVILAIDTPPDHPGSHRPGNLIEKTARTLIHRYDSRYGGFGTAPKFPSVPTLQFLLRYAVYSQNQVVLTMICHTLDRMAYGGIHDHLDGGFHRYSTDAAWKLPHFEKMLYDQAMCAIIYTEAWQVTQKKEYCTVAMSALEYMISSLSDPEGGFYASLDADSAGSEGAYYLWTYDEFTSLTGDDAELACELFGVTKEGNVSQMHGMKPGDNVLHPGKNPFEKSEKLPTHEFEERYSRIIQNLLTARNLRIKPETDDKVLTDWNGLTIVALTYSGMVFQIDKYLERAVTAAEFLAHSMIRNDGSVHHRWRAGQVGIMGTASDYINTAWAFVFLFQATGNVRWLNKSLDLEREASKRFYDPLNGGYYQVQKDSDLPVRLKDTLDGPVPSVNGTGYHLLRILAGITGQEEYLRKVREMEMMFFNAHDNPGMGITSFLGGYCEKKNEIRAVMYGNPDVQEFREMKQLLWSSYLPGLVRIIITEESFQQFFQHIPGFVYQGDEPVVHICAGNQCYQPVTSAEKLRDCLQKLNIFESDKVSHSVQTPDQ